MEGYSCDEREHCNWSCTGWLGSRAGGEKSCQWKRWYTPGPTWAAFIGIKDHPSHSWDVKRAQRQTRLLSPHSQTPFYFFIFFKWPQLHRLWNQSSSNPSFTQHVFFPALTNVSFVSQCRCFPWETPECRHNCSAFTHCKTVVYDTSSFFFLQLQWTGKMSDGRLGSKVVNGSNFLSACIWRTELTSPAVKSFMTLQCCGPHSARPASTNQCLHSDSQLAHRPVRRFRSWA